MAVKVLSADASQREQSVDKLLRVSTDPHPGQQHVERALDSFLIEGPSGHHHLCKAMEPLGGSLHTLLDDAFNVRRRLNTQRRQQAEEGDGWSVRFAKRTCWQILKGLDFLHQRGVAHRDIHRGNILVALRRDLSLLSENEIQKAVWPAAQVTKPTPRAPSPDSDSDSDSDTDSVTSSESERSKRWRECEEAISQRWAALELTTGDKLAEPHSMEWNRANLWQSRTSIEMLVRVDGRPLEPDEIQYTVAPTPLEEEEGGGKNDDDTRFVLADLSSASTFDNCSDHRWHGFPDFMPPEILLRLPADTTHKVDIFSAGLVFWEVVMLRQLVEGLYVFPDPDRTQLRYRLLRDLTQRLGPLPLRFRAQWPEADRFVDETGRVLDNLAELDDGEVYGPDDFEYGDLWHHARMRKPFDMSDGDLGEFVDLIQQMLQWEPEARPSTAELLRHQWFQDLE